MTFDLDTTYFPQAARDDFGKPFGQNTYLWQWFIGDRTSILSYGWFEFWKLGGVPLYTATARHNDTRFGLSVVTTGINISRPPRGNVFIGYTVLNTGADQHVGVEPDDELLDEPQVVSLPRAGRTTSATRSRSAKNLTVTRIGADYLTTVGIAGDPLRQAYTFAFTITPRLGPGIRAGSSGGLSNFDTRYAPTQ